MAENRFEFNGRVYPAGAGEALKFLLFLVGGGKEMSFFEAKKLGLVQQEAVDMNTRIEPSPSPGAAWSNPSGMYSWVTDFPIAKLFVQEQAPGSPRIVYSFFMLLGHNTDRQIVEIRPRNAMMRSAGFMFKAEAKFLKKSEAALLFEPDSLSARMLHTQQMPPATILKEMITLHKPKAVLREQRVRHLRIPGSGC